MLEQQAETGKMSAAVAEPAKRAELDVLRTRLADTVKTIKTSKIGQVSGGSALYELPWYIVIGNPAAGKSSAVINSGLQFPFADKNSAVIHGIGGTRNCDWFFTTEGILLDTAGRYSVHEEDRSEWLGFLDLLKRYRPKAPINGIIVTASIAELTGNRPEFAINLAKNLRQRVQELTEKLEVFAPVYVMFTKADLITGFTEFFSSNDRQEYDRVWGATLPYEPDEKRDVVALFDQRFEELYDGLKEISVAQLSVSRGNKLSPGQLSFPLEFSTIKPALRSFLATLFEDNPFQYKPIFRGFYFTSALQEGETNSAAAQRIAHRFGLDSQSLPKPHSAFSKNGFFLRDLFSKVIFADRQTVRQFASPTKTRVRYATFFGFVAALALALGGWTWSTIGNQQLVSNVQADLDNVTRLQQNRNDLQSRLQAMDILEDRIEQLEQFRRDKPLSVSLGLYQGNRLEQHLLTEYYNGVRQILLAPVSDNLASFLKDVNAHPDQLAPMTRAPESGATPAGPMPVSTHPAAPGAAPSPAVAQGRQQGGLYNDASPTNVEDAYNALKTYLMLSDKRHVEQAHLTDQVARFWRGWLETNRGNMPRDEMIRSAERMITFYLSRVSDNDWPMIEANLALVDQTRENLRRVVRGMPARQRVYEEIKARASTRFAPMTIARIVGEGNTGLVAGSYAIPGTFTRDAWFQYVQPAIRDAATKELQAKDWVLNTASADDLTLEGSPEQIQKTLVAMYKTEYAQHWQKFMQGIAVQGFGNFTQAVDAMNKLGDPQDSPIRKVLETAYDQTSWDNPSLANATIKKAQTGVVNWVKQWFTRQPGGQIAANVDINGNPADVPMGPIGQEFVGLGRIVATHDGTSMLKGYMDTLSKVRTRFNVIKNQGDPGPGARQLMQQTLDGNGSELADSLKFVDEQMLTGLTDSQRKSLRPLLVRPLMQAFAVVIQPASVEVNKVWNAQVYQPFQNSLANKYPFAAGAKVEAGAGEIAQVFGPDGSIAKCVGTTLGPLAVRWYGLMYLVGFILAIVVGRLRLKLPHVAAQGWSAKDIDDMMFYGVLGVVLGGRLGYVLFYKAGYYFSHPLDIFRVWEGGMSFHGGFLGVTLAMALFAWQRKRHWLEVTDFVAPMVPTGLAAGRLGNFINGELWGRVTSPDAPWAMLFPGASRDDAAWLAAHQDIAAKWNLNEVFLSHQMLPRHPSQLYEIALEGIALFFVLWFFSRKPRPMGAISALFLIGYGAARFTVEFAREPDDFLGLLTFGLSMGQWLSLPMIVAGVLMMIWAYRRGGVAKQA